MMIKAIETTYKGYRFRSRLEARYAIFFDTLGIKWEYENEGYDLGELGWYLPDFEIELSDGCKWFVEIKGNKNDSVGIAKAQFLDDYPPLTHLGCRLFESLDLLKPDYDDPGCPDRVSAILLGVSVAMYNKAIKKARRARFEHGETP